MRNFIVVITGVALLSGLPTVQAQEPRLPEATNLAIPLVRLAPDGAAATPAPPKVTGFADIIRARFPLTIKYSELGVGWRIIEFRGANYFTKGDTTILNNEEYLVAYLAQMPQVSPSKLDTRDYIRVATTGQTGSYEPDDRFAITLVRMADAYRTVVNGQTGLRSFSAEALTADDELKKFNPPINTPAYRQKLTGIYLTKIYQAISSYSQTYLNVLPPMDSAFAARQALLPFAENDAIFTLPGTSTPYKVNPLFSERKREHLRNKGRLVMVYEGVAAGDGMRAVLFYNGRVQRVDAEAWQRWSKASGLE